MRQNRSRLTETEMAPVWHDNYDEYKDEMDRLRKVINETNNSALTKTWSLV